MRGRSGEDGATELSQLGWRRENSGGRTNPMAKEGPKRYGLYDMRGNGMGVGRGSLGKNPVGTVTDLAGPPPAVGAQPTRMNAALESLPGRERVVRGAIGNDPEGLCVPSTRNPIKRHHRSGIVGFRLATERQYGREGPKLGSSCRASSPRGGTR